MLLRSFTALCLLASLACAEDWPEFRGPTQDGVVASAKAPVVWGEGDGVAWKTPLPGRAWSSPVVMGDQIWMTTAVEQLASVEERQSSAEGLAKSFNQPVVLAQSLSLRALCVDRVTGELVRDVELFSLDEVDPIHTLNSYASPTPVIEPGRLYCHFGTNGNACIDTSTGEVLWRRVLPLKHYVGPGSSPVVCGDLLILTCDGADQQYVTALDKTTGETVWRRDRPPIRQENPDFPKVVLHAAGAHSRRPAASCHPRRAVDRRLRTNNRRRDLAARPRQRFLGRATACDRRPARLLFKWLP